MRWMKRALNLVDLDQYDNLGNLDQQCDNLGNLNQCITLNKNRHQHKNVVDLDQ